MKAVIGFGGKFYTLWHYEVEYTYVTDSYGQHHVSGTTTKYYYSKNISTDLDSAKAAYPEAKVDEGLKGTRRYYERRMSVELPKEYFWFGKYNGKKIDEILVSDPSYCEWAANGTSASAYITNHPLYLSRRAEEKSKGLKVGDEVEVEFTRNGYNPDGHTCVTDGICGDIELTMVCMGYQPVTGLYPYIMPKVNGKTAKTKGKIIKIKVVEVLSTQVYRGRIYQNIIIA